MASSASAPGAGADQNYTSFPAVTTEELLLVLHEMNIAVSTEDLARPQGAMVQKVYLAFLDTLAGTMPEMLERERDEIVRGMDDKVRACADARICMTTASRGCSCFAKCTLRTDPSRAMMEAATVHDFHLQDLTRPTPKRFKRHMSALVNFFRFRSDRLAEFDELVLQTEALENERLALEAGAERARDAIAEIMYVAD